MDVRMLKIILKKLRGRYGTRLHTRLKHRNMTELFVAVLLSPQCNDNQVNNVTKSLFKKYTTLEDYANADLDRLQKDLSGLNYYRTKARNLKEAAKRLGLNFNGRIPKSIAEMVSLRGVGRKVANVVLNEGYGINEGIAIDTHCTRVSGRLHIPGGREKNPVRIEQWLMENADRKEWGGISNLFIALGRDTCRPRKECDRCVLRNVCPSSNAMDKR